MQEEESLLTCKTNSPTYYALDVVVSIYTLPSSLLSYYSGKGRNRLLGKREEEVGISVFLGRRRSSSAKRWP